MIRSVFCSLGEDVVLRVAPLVAAPVFMVPERDVDRTRPFSLRELAERWGVSVDTVEEIVPTHRRIRLGKKKWAVRVAMVLKIEEEKEGAR